MGVGGGCSVVFAGPNPPLSISETHLLGRKLVREPYEYLMPVRHTSKAFPPMATLLIQDGHRSPSPWPMMGLGATTPLA